LANKSQARLCSESLQSALEANLSGPGSMIYSTVWKPHVTPLGRQIYRLRASGRRTSDSEHSLERSGWPTPRANDAEKRGAVSDDPRNGLVTAGNLSGWITPQAHDPSPRGSGQKLKHGTKHGCADLNADAALSGWNTPRATDGSNGGPNQAGGALTPDAALSGWPTPNAVNGDRTAYKDFDKLMARKAAGRQTNLQEIVMVAGWPSPTVGNAMGSQMAKDASTTGRRPDGSKATVSLNAVAQASGWPTPTSQDHNVPLNALLGRVAWLTANPQAARITADGIMLTGCSAGMESGGQLNPAFSGWLMGFPEAWCKAAISCQLPARLRKAPKKPVA